MGRMCRSDRKKTSSMDHMIWYASTTPFIRIMGYFRTWYMYSPAYMHYCTAWSYGIHHTASSCYLTHTATSVYASTTLCRSLPCAMYALYTDSQWRTSSWSDATATMHPSGLQQAVCVGGIAQKPPCQACPMRHSEGQHLGHPCPAHTCI